MNLYERFALSEYLYAFPDDREYDEVLDMLMGNYTEENETDEVIVWDVFDNTPRVVVAELIDSLKDRLFGTYVSREEKASV
jgi:hypothetical protein